MKSNLKINITIALGDRRPRELNSWTIIKIHPKIILAITSFKKAWIQMIQTVIQITPEI